MSNENYSVEFYHKHYEGSYSSASIILSYLKQYLCINSIVNFGCGIGTWCVAAAELDIPTIYGIDSNTLPRTQIKELTIGYKNLDLSKNITLQYQFDLAISVEVAEHIPETDINTYLKNIIAPLSTLGVTPIRLPFQTTEFFRLPKRKLLFQPKAKSQGNRNVRLHWITQSSSDVT